MTSIRLFRFSLSDLSGPACIMISISMGIRFSICTRVRSGIGISNSISGSVGISTSVSAFSVSVCIFCLS